MHTHIFDTNGLILVNVSQIENYSLSLRLRSTMDYVLLPKGSRGEARCKVNDHQLQLNRDTDLVNMEQVQYRARIYNIQSKYL